jgi:hypothetical protein
MEFGHIIKPRRNKKDFEFFQKIPKQTHDAFAWLRPSPATAKVAGESGPILVPARVEKRLYETGQDKSRHLRAQRRHAQDMLYRARRGCQGPAYRVLSEGWRKIHPLQPKETEAVIHGQ